MLCARRTIHLLGRSNIDALCLSNRVLFLPMPLVVADDVIYGALQEIIESLKPCEGFNPKERYLTR